MFKNWLFGNYSVDSILGEFHGLIARLEAAVDYHKEQSVNHAVKADQYAELSEQSTDEAARAQNVADKLKSLVG